MGTDDKIYPIVCLCGSTRFKDEFYRCASELTLENKIVVMPHVFFHADNAKLTAKTKRELTSLHFAKIRMADEVFVVNVDGYIGDATASEIEYAEFLGIPVTYLE